LKKSGLPAFLIAILCVAVPLAMGAIVTYVYDKNIMEAVFMGVI
jgi:Kef-type K+ transport system membrane component KefB